MNKSRSAKPKPDFKVTIKWPEDPVERQRAEDHFVNVLVEFFMKDDAATRAADVAEAEAAHVAAQRARDEAAPLWLSEKDAAALVYLSAPGVHALGEIGRVKRRLVRNKLQYNRDSLIAWRDRTPAGAPTG